MALDGLYEGCQDRHPPLLLQCELCPEPLIHLLGLHRATRT